MNGASSLDTLHRVTKTRLLVLLCGLTAIAALRVRAVEPEQSTARGQLQEIVVTALKRAENVQQGPMAIQADKDNADGCAFVTYGRHNLTEYEGGGALPVPSHAAVRLAGIYHSRDGIWHNLDPGDRHYGDEKRYSERATMVWEPTASTRVTVSAHSARSNGVAPPLKMAGALLDKPPLRINVLAALTCKM